MILPCGILSAPGTWPRSNDAGPRASTSTKPGCADCSASCTSQQSVSNANCASKCCRACAGAAAAMAVTALDMTYSGVRVMHCRALAAVRKLAQMTISVQISPKLKRPRKVPANRLVTALVYDGLCSFEFGCAAEVFGLARPEFDFDWYRFVACAVEPGPLRAVGGMSVSARGRLADIAKAGTVIIPGWRGIDVAPPAALLRALRAAHARGARLLSICSGVFVLAAAGLLDGRRATTHWRYAQTLRQRYPPIEVDANVLYVDNGQILTSAGSAAGLDLCLHLVRRDYGAVIANQVARRLVIAPHRSGGQAQFIERPMPRHDDDNRLARLLDRISTNPAEPTTIAGLAARAAMSERTFLRRFREATGATPADWIAQARVDRARELLESTALSIEHVARECGFGSAMTLRHHFRNKLALSPSEYKDRFGKAPARQQR